MGVEDTDQDRQAKALLEGKIQTVTGPISTDHSEFTLPVEHLLADQTQNWNPPNEAHAREIFFSELSDETIAWGRYYGLRSLAVGRLGNVTDAIDEIDLFKQWGGGSLVDATGSAGGRDPVGLARIARATDINVIMTATPPINAGTDENGPEVERAMARTIAEEITTGINGTGIRAGVISNDRGDGRPTDDLVALRACALAQIATGAPIFISPGPRDTDPLAALEVLSEIGVDPEAITFAHMGGYSRRVVKSIVDSGCRIVFDGFGHGTQPASDYTFINGLDSDTSSGQMAGWPDDEAMLATIGWLASTGHGDRMLVSHNISSADRYMKHGGHGYHYLLANIAPRMRTIGLGESLIEQLLVQNPAEALKFRAAVDS